MSKKYNIADIQAYALSKGGKCISVQYLNGLTKYDFECSLGHQWKSTWSSMLNSASWCPVCAYDSKRTSFTTIKDFITSKNGILLSTEYINAKGILELQCEYGHYWKTSWGCIKNNITWCPTCSKKAKPIISFLQEYAINKGGVLLSSEYINNNTKLEWQCEQGHSFKSVWASVKLGNWCPHCSGNYRTDIKVLQEHARSLGGELLSTEYVNNNTKMLWRCSKNHTWTCNWMHIKAETWCPECSTFKSEKECIALAENILGISLKKKRIYYDPKLLSNYIELDGYNEEAGIAIEYNGVQHYKYVPFFHGVEQNFIEQQTRDERKRNYCKENNIILIEVPYTENKTMESFITNYVKENELNIVVNS